MSSIVFIWFCMETKLEVAGEDVEQYLSDNPLHHLVECVRTNDPIVEGQPPVVTQLIPGEEAVAVQAVVDSLSGSGSIADTIFPLTFSESALSANDWCEIGAVSDTNAGFILPFDVKIVGMSVQWKRIKNGDQTVLVYNDESSVYETPVQTEQEASAGWTTTGLNIPIAAGEKLRVRGGDLAQGYFDKCIVNLIVKKV